MRWGAEMTWSIVARDPANGHLGVAVASRFFAVGAVVPHLRGRVGAVATQAFVNPTYGPDGLRMLAAGQAPDAIIRTLTARDDGRAQRQFHLIGMTGQPAVFTGKACVDWAGHMIGDDVSVAGNMLEGPAVVAETMRAFEAAADRPLAERLLIAMQAGEAAGGDKRGRQSAALVVYRDQDYAWLDIRADDDGDPLAELRRLYAVAQERYLHVAETMATRENPHGMIDRRVIDDRIAALEAERLASGTPSLSRMTVKG